MENNQITITERELRETGVLLDINLKFLEYQGYKIQHSYDSDEDGKVYILDKPIEESKDRMYSLEELKKVYELGKEDESKSYAIGEKVNSFDEFLKTLN